MGIFQKYEVLNKTKQQIKKTTFITLYNLNYAINLDKNSYLGKFENLINVELPHPL